MTQDEIAARINRFHEVDTVLYDAAVQMELMLGTLPVPNFYFDELGNFRGEEFSRNRPSLGNIQVPRAGRSVYSISQGPRTGLNVKAADPIYLTTTELDLCVAGKVHMGIAEELAGEPVDPTDPFDSSQRIWGFAIYPWGYVFSSVGPDGVRDIQHISDPADFVSKINLVYDPTNGILSTGDLISRRALVEASD